MQPLIEQHPTWTAGTPSCGDTKAGRGWRFPGTGQRCSSTASCSRRCAISSPARAHERDPFGSLKRRQEAEALARFAEGWSQLDAAAHHLSEAQVFEALLHSALWGNRADLSNFTVRELAQAGLATQAERHNLLIDDTQAVEALLSPGVDRVDFICDNVGLDLLFDLALADFLLGRGWAQQVTLHLKNQPFFVSDAMPADASSGYQRAGYGCQPRPSKRSGGGSGRSLWPAGCGWQRTPSGQAF